MPEARGTVNSEPIISQSISNQSAKKLGRNDLRGGAHPKVGLSFSEQEAMVDY
jgi:hypothetical protein